MCKIYLNPENAFLHEFQAYFKHKIVTKHDKFTPGPVGQIPLMVWKVRSIIVKEQPHIVGLLNNYAESS